MLEKLTEILIGDLSLREPDDRQTSLIDKLNAVIKPPRPATPDNVNIRAMYIVNDLINSHGGRFRRDDLQHLCELICDTPVLIGHNRSEAPLARTFHAELEENGSVLWVKSYFYWPKSPENAADELLLKIDSGVFKECSISFVYTFPECSICGEDFRNCPHAIEQNSRDATKAHFIYRGISQVLETSLVYKGSVKGTHITDKLSHENAMDISEAVINGLADLSLITNSIAAVIALDQVSIPQLRQICAAPNTALAVTKKDNQSYLLIRRR